MQALGLSIKYSYGAVKGLALTRSRAYVAGSS
jgi:hypothetical protein